MLVIFVPLNGVGLGHLSRAFAISEYLQTCGDAPVIFAQGSYPDFMARRVPGVSVKKAIYKMVPAERIAFASDLENYASSEALVVIEDTHPGGFSLSPHIRRYLIVRPTTMNYLRLLRSNYSSVYRSFLIVDHPDSPTWPFSVAETDEIASWKNWIVVGPIARLSTTAQQEQLVRKYTVRPDVKLFVFSMGGGGMQDSGHDDISSFLHRASTIGKAIRRVCPGCRLLFVRGSLFPTGRPLGPLFEDILVEPEMPSLLALASGAVVRPGYNITWECIFGRTPLLAISGTTYNEPITERLQALERNGLLATRIQQLFDRQWIAKFRRVARETSSRWPQAIGLQRIRELIINQQLL